MWTINFRLFNNAVCSVEVTVIENNRKMVKNSQESRRCKEVFWLLQDTVSPFAWTIRRNLRENVIKICSNFAEIGAGYIPNISL
jgi:hypothetical protein